jgi:hypothetical protein
VPSNLHALLIVPGPRQGFQLQEGIFQFQEI